MSLIRAFVASLYDFSWLQSARKNFGKAFGYAMICILLSSALRILPALWEVPSLIKQADKAVETQMPEFTAEATNGKLLIKDVPQPFVKVFNDTDGSEVAKVIVDTVSTTTPSIVSYTKTGAKTVIVLITADGFTTYDGVNESTKTQSWKELPNGKWTKSDMTQFVKKFVGIVSYVIAPILIFFLFIFFAVGKLFYLLIMSLVVLVVSAIAGKGWKYGEIYTVGLYAITVPTLVTILLETFRLPIPFIYTAILLVYMLVPMFQKGPEVPAQPTTPAAEPQNKA